MKDTKLGFTFREVMSGGFALGATEPLAGEKAGRAAGTIMSLHATILIDDLAAFIALPEHLGSIAGQLDFSPWGQAIPASRGVFNLFSPAEDPAMKLMVYELAFDHGGQPYYLAGHKEVKDDPGFDLWQDTTTLLTTLHEGNDKTGRIVGAGVLSLGPVELAKMVTTMHATGASSVGEEVGAVAKFGRFFLGEVWESYFAKAKNES